LGHIPCGDLSDLRLLSARYRLLEFHFEEESLKRASVLREDSRLLGVVAAVAVIAMLYFARVVFIPLALALLFSVVLAPPVAFLERIKLPRILAILLVVVTLAALIGLLGWRSSQQFVDFTDQFPTYKAVLQDKIHFVKGSSSQSFNKASDTVKELEKEMGAPDSGPSPSIETRRAPAALGSSASRPLAVAVVPPANPFQSVENLFGPLATSGVVIIFTIFILAGREDLRNRLIRLASGGRLNLLTQALDEATQRINRYLLLQLAVNAGYGLVIFTALHFIGIPNASLWGVSAAILRFLPYIGPPLAALMPVFLSLAVFPGWGHALATAGLFLVLELIVSNVLEPLLYGAHLGLSPLAILVAAVFWTLIWGFPGLVLSTPLTVCLVVMGRYVPSMSFLNIVLGDGPVLPPHALYYQRLLAADQNEARQVLEQCLKDTPLEEIYSSVVIPALSLAEQDRHRNELDERTQTFIYQSTREIIEELSVTSEEQPAEATTENPSRISSVEIDQTGVVDILCIPSRDEADDVVAMLLARVLERHGHRAQAIPIGTTAQMLSQVTELNPNVVCISALPPFAVNHARALYARLRIQSPELHIVVCLWQFEGDPQKAALRLKLARDHGFFSTLPQVLQHISLRAKTIVPVAGLPEPLPVSASSPA
jgi:predicted PurR-regulated permease PerM